MYPTHLRRALPLVLLALAACATHTPAATSATTPSTSATPSTASPPRTSRSVLTDAELPAGGTESVYDVIQRLRPEYLRMRPPQTNSASSNSSAPIAVFADGQHLGDVSELRRIPVSSIKSVRHYTIEEGKQRFGMQYGSGVIEIVYRNQ